MTMRKIAPACAPIAMRMPILTGPHSDRVLDQPVNADRGHKQRDGRKADKKRSLEPTLGEKISEPILKGGHAIERCIFFDAPHGSLNRLSQFQRVRERRSYQKNGTPRGMLGKRLERLNRQHRG